MQDFTGKKILLGVCGGIAAYKSTLLARELTQLGAEVRVVMTQSAHEFVTPMTMQALTGHTVRCDLFDPQAERAMGHIELARWADYLLIAPASANYLAKMAHGQADDLLSTLYLVAETPVLVCPAMNQSMWAHAATQANCQLLSQRGVMIIGPEEGSQACGEFGYGRMSEIDDIINALRLVEIKNRLQGKRVLITAGPTREPIDPVRYLTNRSSGKMGYALATAAKAAGAEVTLVSGPTALLPPKGVQFHAVETAKQMHQVVMENLERGVVFIAAAAVADYRVKATSQQKLKKQNGGMRTLDLEENPDVLMSVSESLKPSFILGFAAETENVVPHALEKLNKKKLDMIIANEVGENKGFDSDFNQVFVLTNEQQTTLPYLHKTQLAGQIIAILAENLQNVAK